MIRKLTMFGTLKMWLVPIMMLVMLASVLEARDEVCSVDVGRSSAHGPKAFDIEKWRVKGLLRRHWKRQRGGWVPGSVTLRCGNSDISILDLSHLRRAWKTITSMRRLKQNDD